jgi:membrane-associated protease RseP (regulator of RpoE activity)
MIRTSRGLEILEKISKAKTFWRWFANLGVPVVFAGMIFMFVLIILTDIILFTTPPEPSELTEPRNVLLLPGVNKFIPLVWGIIGLIVTLVVHEFSHAILSRVEGVRVKSLGVLYALIPIGGFAEPDEEELTSEKTTRMQRIRIFSAGVISNFVVALIAFLLFMHLLGSLSSGGVYVTGIYKDFPAQEAGITPGIAIFRINETDTPDLKTFQDRMAKTKPGELIKVYAYDENGNVNEFTLNLTKNPYGDSGFMGVEVLDMLVIMKEIPVHLNSVTGWLMIISMPFTFFGGFSGVFMHLFEPTGIWADTGNVLFYLLNTLYWIGWINFYVGLFNCLPAIPLDGGRVFYESFSAILTKRYGKRGEEISVMIVKFMAFLIFASILLSILIPNISRFTV